MLGPYGWRCLRCSWQSERCDRSGCHVCFNRRQDGPAERTHGLGANLGLAVQLCSAHVREATKLDKDQLLAAFHLLVVLTRNHSYASRFAREGGVRLIFEPFRVLEPKHVSGCQPHVAIVLRHIVEDAQTLATAMRQEIHSLLSESRNKTSDTSTLVRQLDTAILRDPDVFLESAVFAKVEMNEYSPTKGSGHIKLLQDPIDAEKKEARSRLRT